MAQTKHTHNNPNIISQIQYRAPIVQITYTLQALHIISSTSSTRDTFTSSIHIQALQALQAALVLTLVLLNLLQHGAPSVASTNWAPASSQEGNFRS